jgi:AbrB family looped-hinge helix DNA binding protein
MSITVKVSTEYRVVIPQMARRKLDLKQGDHLLVDVQDGVIILTPKPKHHADRFQGLYSEIWKGIDVRKYINGERKAWTNSVEE